MRAMLSVLLFMAVPQKRAAEAAPNYQRLFKELDSIALGTDKAECSGKKPQVLLY